MVNDTFNKVESLASNTYATKATRSIYRSINNITSKRTISTNVTTVCRDAKVSCATFYTHFKSCEDARNTYEAELETELLRALPNKLSNKELVFTILLTFLRNNRYYFQANFLSGNIFLLRKIMLRLKYILGNGPITGRSYSIYIGAIIAMLEYWVIYEKCNEPTIPEYTKKLIQMPVYRG